MTQISRPWAGTTIGDAGPYTAANWWDVWQTLGLPHVGAFVDNAAVDVGNRGVIYKVAGRLAPSSPADNSVDIAAGAAFVDGLLYYNDAVVNFSIPSAAAGNVRVDRVVLRKTFAAVTQTARLTLLTGAEVAAPGPASAPAITQDAARTTFYDLAICQVGVDDAGNITLVSEVEYVDVVAKTVLENPVTGWNVTAGSWITGDIVGIPLADAAVCVVGAWFPVPTDIVLGSEVDISAIVYAPSAANAVLVVRAEMQLTEFLLHTGQVQAVAPGQADYTYNFRTTYRDIAGTTISNLVLGDMISAAFFRYGNHANDTLASFLDVVAFKMDYLGWR